MQPITKRVVHQAQQAETNIDISPRQPRRVSAPGSSNHSRDEKGSDSGLGTLALAVCGLLAIFLLFSDSSQIRYVLAGLLHAPRLFFPAPAAHSTPAAVPAAPIQQQPFQQPQPAQQPVLAPPICKSSTQYFPSDLEKFWLDNAAAWQNDYCAALETGKLLDGASSWLTKMHEEADAEGKGATHIGDKPVLAFPPSVFSRFVTKVTCEAADGTSSDKETTSFIEPLSHGLRHPYALCETSSELLKEISHLLLADKDDLAALKTAALNQPCGEQPCRSIFLDIGATEWRRSDGPGKGWMTKKYAQRGIQFDSLVLWDPLTGSAQPDQVPPEFSSKLITYSAPAITDASHQEYPLNVLKSLAEPSDFVVLKLAIPGNHKAELDILKALMEDAEASPLVDELFFEHRVAGFPEMAKHWNETAEQGKSLADSYKLFQEMRQRGWRAHAWV